MAKMEQEESTAIDKKAAKRAAKMKKKEEKKKKKEQQGTESEGEGGVGGRILIILVTVIIVVVWLAILALLIKLDVGGFGSTVLHPMLKDVPYVNMILPEVKEEDAVVDVQYPYTTIEAAIGRIKELEIELSKALEAKDADSDTLAQLQAEITRLQKFEQEQSEFQKLKTEFYQEIVFADNAPAIEEYQKYYESIDAANAAELYKQVVQQGAYKEQVDDYVEQSRVIKD